MLEKLFLDIKKSLCMWLVDIAQDLNNKESFESLIKEFSFQINQLKLLEIELRNYNELSKPRQKQICESINAIVTKMKRS